LLRVEWTITDYACALRGIVTVPVYDSLGPVQIASILNETECRVVVCTADKLSTLETADCPHIRIVICIDCPDEKNRSSSQAYRILRFSDIARAGAEARSTRPELNQYPEVLPTDTYTIIYTSGTTGGPKGVVLSHRNILAGCAGVTEYGLVADPGTCSYVSYLPLAHVLERLVFLIILFNGAKCGFYSGNVAHMVSDVQTLKPTHFFGVPRVFNRIYLGVSNEISKKDVIQRGFFNVAMWWKQSCLSEGYGHDYNSWLNWAVFDKIRQGMGGNIQFILSGSAPLSADVQAFLSACFCCPVAEGYGMTEAYPISLGLPMDSEPRQAGPPMAHVELKLRSVPDLRYSIHDHPYPRGEVLVRGPHVFQGYYKHPEITAQVLDSEGWYSTGDIAELLPGYRIRVIDRKKDIFKLAQGEFISAENVECKYLLSRLVAQIFVYGDPTRTFLVALVSPNEPALCSIFPRLQKLPLTNPPQIDYSLVDSEVENYILSELATVHAQAGMNGLHKIKGVKIVPPFTMESGTLTPTHKVVRPAVKKAFVAEIEHMYQTIGETTKPSTPPSTTNHKLT